MIGSSHGCLMQSVDAKRTPPDSLDQIIFVNGKKRTGGGQFSTFLLHLALDNRATQSSLAGAWSTSVFLCVLCGE